MLDLFNVVSSHGTEIYTFLTSIVAAASIAANWTHTDKDNRVVGKIDKLVHLLALNFFSVKNVDDKKLNQ